MSIERIWHSLPGVVRFLVVLMAVVAIAAWMGWAIHLGREIAGRGDMLWGCIVAVHPFILFLAWRMYEYLD